MAEPLKIVEVDATRWWVDTGIDVAPGDRLRFEATGTWWDAGYEAGPNGRDIESIRRFRRWRRMPAADWVTLIGIVGRFGERHRIGSTASIRFGAAGRLRLCANDVLGFYRNNSGAVSVGIYRD